jgi:membrane-bound lytic murein transglycosylase A
LPVEAVRLTPIDFTEIDGWQEDDQSAALAALLRSCRAAGTAAASPCAIAMTLGEAGTRGAARAFFEAHYAPHRIGSGAEPGLVTGYYEPEVFGARARGGRFQVPVHGRPGDLVPIAPDLERARFNDRLTSMRQMPEGLVPAPRSTAGRSQGVGSSCSISTMR